MDNRNVIGLDLAKNVFQLHIANSNGKKVKSLRIRREHLLETFATLPPALVRIEACGSAHHWARELSKLGHEIKMMAPSTSNPTFKATRPMPEMPWQSAKQQHARQYLAFVFERVTSNRCRLCSEPANYG